MMPHRKQSKTAIPGKEYSIDARSYTQTKSNMKTRTDPSGAICGTPLQQQLRLKVGAKVMMTYNVDTCDSLTNGVFGEVLGFKFNKEGNVSQVYVHFYDEDCGKTRRKSFVSLQSCFPGKNVTPIDLMEFQFSLSKKKKSFTKNATAYQFPLKLAFAATAHKIQGQTIKKPNFLVADLRKVREAAQAYVILSRVQAIDQLFLIESACIDKIYASTIALEEVKRMTDAALNLKVHEANSILSCNIRRLKTNISKFSRSSQVSSATVICLQETWTEKAFPDTNLFRDYFTYHHSNSVGPGKGILTLYNDSYEIEKDVQEALYQMTKIASKTTDIINVYRSQGANTAAFERDLLELIYLNRETIIVGDFNICHEKNSSHSIITMLENLGFHQIVKYPTHIDGGTIDLVFILNPGDFRKYHVQQQGQYYLDHDIMIVRYGICSYK